MTVGTNCIRPYYFLRLFYIEDDVLNGGDDLLRGEAGDPHLVQHFVDGCGGGVQIAESDVLKRLGEGLSVLGILSGGQLCLQQPQGDGYSLLFGKKGFFASTRNSSMTFNDFILISSLCFGTITSITKKWEKGKEK